jgi:hypothetical protein
MSPGSTRSKSRLLLAFACLVGCVDLTRPGGVGTTVDALVEPTADAPPDHDSGDAAGLDVPPRPDAEPADGGSIDTPTPVEAARDLDPPHDVPGMADAPDLMPSLDTGATMGRAPGETCGAVAACADGHCVAGICCATACSDACHACDVPGHAGTCLPKAAGTLCAPGGCSNGVATTESRCTAAGECPPAVVTSCGAFACYMTFCGSACLASSDCVAPYTCAGASCTSPGLLLYWPFDEGGGNVAQDASSNGRTGSMIGSTGAPQPSAVVAPLKFPNPRSRDFVASDSQGVVASPIPGSIKANPELTLAAWFRATAVEVDGSDIIDLGADYSLRVRSDRIEFTKRKATQAGNVYALAAGMATPIDSTWHHLAGTSGAGGMKIYLDGVEAGSAGNNLPPIFDGPDQIGVGHQPGSSLHDHTGQIDDVRIYGRALTAAEILNLARGQR